MSDRILAGLLASVCTLTLYNTAHAQTDEQKLGPIVVTAARNDQSLDEVTRSVAIVDAQQIERSVSESVTEALRDIPGIKIVDSSTPGMKRLSIRGENAFRNVILIDGQEITDHTSYGAVFLIAPPDIERVEVVKGPGSVLHGSKAIGGVVNIITKKGADRPLQVEVGSSFDSATNGYNAFTSASGTVDRWDYRVSLTKSDHGDRETANGTLEGSSFDNQSASAFVGYNGDQHNFSIKAERFELESDVYTGDADFPFDLPKRDRSKLSFFYDFEDVNDAIAKVSLDGYFQRIDRIAKNGFKNIPALTFPLTTPPSVAYLQNRSNHIESQLDTFGLNGQIDLTLMENVLTLAGVQMVHETLDRESEETGTNVIPVSPPVLTPVATTSQNETTQATLSAFLQNEWDVAEDLTLTGGGRYYFVSVDNKGTAGDLDKNDQAFVGALGLNYTGFESLALRASLSQGYVYPTIIQSTAGTSFSPAGIILGNSDLDPEKSVTAEIGGRFDDGTVLLDASLFYTDAKDYITTERISTSTSKYVNIDSAQTWGLELAASYRFAEWDLTPYLNTTLMRRQFKSATRNTFNTNTPLISGRIGVTKDWTFDNGIEAYADLYTRFASIHEDFDSRERPISEPAYATLNLSGGFQYDFDDKRSLKVNAAIENILDRDYKASLEELEASGRAFKLSASVIF